MEDVRKGEFCHTECMMRASSDIEEAMARYADTVYRACAVFFGRTADTDDAFQDTFLRYAGFDGDFHGEEHRKAWFIRVATNICKDMLKAARRTESSLEDAPPSAFVQETVDDNHVLSEHRIVLDAMKGLDDPPRTPLYLALYEGYTAPEIAEMLDIPVNTVYSHIARGRTKLKEALQ